jgi:signal transduction histidine kinase
MKRSNTLIYHVLVFTFAQLAWFSLLGLWIYWYISNYIIINQVGDKLSPQIISESTNLSALVGGLILLVMISVGMSLIFIYLTKQVNLTKLYDNFIANVTHELKSPLSSIQLYLETLSSRNVPGPQQKNFIMLMMKDTERLNSLITSILNISGIEQKKIAYNYQVSSADEIMYELINEAKTEFKLQGEHVEIEGGTDCQIVVDRRALKIALNNLFDNAIKYSREIVQLLIRFSRNSKYFIIEFSDQGIGISVKDQATIFNKFQRIYNQRSPNVKGTGLGLYWVKEIIRSHGGRISVFSAGQDFGSTFKIELPIYQRSKKRYVKYLLKITQKRKNLVDSYDE